MAFLMAFVAFSRFLVFVAFWAIPCHMTCPVAGKALLLYSCLWTISRNVTISSTIVALITAIVSVSSVVPSFVLLRTLVGDVTVAIAVVAFLV